jgi:hypothetical protein
MAVENVLLQPVEYKVDETAFGHWRRFLSPQGMAFAEFTSHRRIWGMPLLHYTSGISPETGKRKPARGFFAVGRVAIGVVAVGQAAFGVVAIGQMALGVVFGLGQLATGALALGQAAIGLAAAGQVAIGVVAAGQVAVGYYALAAFGFGVHLWMPRHVDPAAQAFFRSLIGR